MAAELLILLVVVRPLSLLAHPFPIGTIPARQLLGQNDQAVTHFFAIAALASALYLSAYVCSIRCRGRLALAVVMSFTVLFGVTLLLTFPAASPDLFNYIVDGRMAWLHGLNPIIFTRAAAASDALYGAQSCCQDLQSPYGPVWQLLLFFPTHLAGDDFVANVVAFRAVSLVFLIGSAYLTARIATARAGGFAAAAALTVGWSPLLLWEVAVNGHNDIVMAAFAVFALERAQQRHWLAVLPLLTLSILSKYLTLLLVPLVLIDAIRSDGRRALRPLAFGTLLSMGLAALVIAPFWAGPSTFGELLRNESSFMWSPAELLAYVLQGTPSSAGATLAAGPGGLAKFVTIVLFIIAYLVIATRLWIRREDLLTAAMHSIFFYLMLAAWWFWSWYLITVVVLAAGLVPARTGRLALLLSCTALLAEVIIIWFPTLFTSPVASISAFVGILFVPALTYWVVGIPRPSWLAAAFGD